MKPTRTYVKSFGVARTRSLLKCFILDVSGSGSRSDPLRGTRAASEEKDSVEQCESTVDSREIEEDENDQCRILFAREYLLDI